MAIHQYNSEFTALVSHKSSNLRTPVFNRLIIYCEVIKHNTSKNLNIPMVQTQKLILRGNF